MPVNRSRKLPDTSQCRTKPYTPKTKKGIHVCLVDHADSCPYSLGFDGNDSRCFCYHEDREKMSRARKETTPSDKNSPK